MSHVKKDKFVIFELLNTKSVESLYKKEITLILLFVLLMHFKLWIHWEKNMCNSSAWNRDILETANVIFGRAFFFTRYLRYKVVWIFISELNF